MSPMADEVYDDAIVDIVGPETLVTEPVIVKVRASASIFPSSHLWLSTGHRHLLRHFQAAQLLRAIYTHINNAAAHKRALLRRVLYRGWPERVRAHPVRGRYRPRGSLAVLWAPASHAAHGFHAGPEGQR